MGGNSQSRSGGTREHHQQTKFQSNYIDCSPYVATSDISKYIRDTKLFERDRNLLQEAIVLVAEEDDFIFQNCEIRVTGYDLDVIFASGQAKNIYVINQAGNGDITRKCKDKSLRHTFRDGARSFWSWLGTGARVVAGAIGVASNFLPIAF